MKKNLYSKPGFLFLEGTGGTDLHLSWDDDFGDEDAGGAKKSQASDWNSFWDKNGETITGKSNFDLATPETYPEGFDPSDVTTYDTLLEDQ